MDYIKEFLFLRERINHSYIRPKLLMMLGADSDSIKNALDNPKVWFQIKLRLEMLFDVGENVFLLESPEVFQDLKQEVESVIKRIDENRINLDENNNINSIIIKDCKRLSEILSSMSDCEYLISTQNFDLSIQNYPMKNSADLKKDCVKLSALINKAVELDFKSNEGLKEIGKEYWKLRCSLEKDVITETVKMDREKGVTGTEFRVILNSLFSTDWIAEEALSLHAKVEEKKKRVSVLLVEKNVNSIEELFLQISGKLTKYLEL